MKKAGNKGKINSLCAVIPVYNEEDGLDELIAALKSFRKSAPYDLQVILVDDHSADTTPAMLREAAKAETWITYIRLSRRVGSHAAIIAGLANCDSDCAVFMAADLQDPIELIPEMVALHESGNDVVWGNRKGRDGQSWFEHTSSHLFYRLMMWLTSIENIPFQASFALLSRRAYVSLVANVGTRVSLIVEIPSLGFPVASISFSKPPRRHGVSKWSISAKVLALADAVVSSSYIPLRIMTYTGIVVSFIGFLYAVILATISFLGIIQVQGWASLIIVVLILGGLQILMMGVMGEYLWRISQNTHKRALYLIEEKVNFTVSESKPFPETVTT